MTLSKNEKMADKINVLVNSLVDEFLRDNKDAITQLSTEIKEAI